MNDTRHLLGRNVFGNKPSDSRGARLGGQRSGELVVAGSLENAFSETSGLGLPDGPPDGADKRRRPVVTFDVHGEELLGHPLEELELGTAPASGEEGRGDPRAVHEGSVDVVDYVVEHSQSDGYHC